MEEQEWHVEGNGPMKELVRDPSIRCMIGKEREPQKDIVLKEDTCTSSLEKGHCLLMLQES